MIADRALPGGPFLNALAQRASQMCVDGSQAARG
jgi:hypothetical protein